MSLAVGRLRDRQYFLGSRAQLLYELIGWQFRNATDLKFMNYGYVGDENSVPLTLSPADEAERYCAQLYHAVAAQTDLAGKRVLDVGSGRGGGTSLVHRYFKPRQTVGLDLARQAMRFCRKVYADVPGLSFRRGDAMDMPFASREFDVVMNVESAHCYSDRAGFLAEVHRVLKPGGEFLFTDFTPPRTDPAAAVATFCAELERAGFGGIRPTDVTRNIVRGLDQDDARRRREIRKRFPPGTRRLARLWAGTRESWIYDDFAKGRRAYVMLRATRLGAVSPASSPAPERHDEALEPAPA